jgi:uncharacterized membrane protein YadS
MLDKILVWLRDNEMQFTWFIIGFLVMALLDTLASGNYIMSALNAFLIVVNYQLRPKTK